MSETPREFYVRAVVKRGELEVIMGLEFDPRMEHEGSLRAEMKALAATEIEYIISRKAGANGRQRDLDTPIADAVSRSMGVRWPGRRYFLEVQHDDPDEGWVQVITPSGWPPKAPVAALAPAIDPGEWDRLLAEAIGNLDERGVEVPRALRWPRPADPPLTEAARALRRRGTHEPECASTILGGREDCSCPAGRESQ